MPSTLQVLNGDRAGETHDLVTDIVVLGRHPDCDVQIDVNAVSRFHAHLVRQGDQYAIEDRSSRNGTFVNGKKIEGRVVLADNDKVKICDVTLVFHGAKPVMDTPEARPAGYVLETDDGISSVLSTLDARRGSEMFLKVRPEAKLRAVLEITEATASSFDPDVLFPKILDSLFAIFPHADRAFFIVREDQERLRLKASKMRRGDSDDIRFSRTIVQQALREQQALLSHDASSDERFAMSQSLADFRIRSVMCAPLLTRDRKPLGVIQIDTQNHQHRFEEGDLQILLAIATQSAATLENAQLHQEILRQANMQRELTFAKLVQGAFLPKGSPTTPGYDYAAFYEAAGQVGGDYYDFIRLPDGRLAIVVADVSGKGVPAALLMAKASSDTKVALITHGDDPGLAMFTINNAICDAGLDDKFITMGMCVLDPVAHQLTIVNAGHLSPIIRRKDGSIEEPANDSITGLPLGVLPNIEYRSTTVELAPGELALLCSDGITEAMNTKRDLFTVERLRDTIAAAPPTSAGVADSVLRDVRHHVAGHSQSDDITLVVVARS